MRRELSLKEMIDKDTAQINHEYFLCKKNHYWGESQERGLIQALQTYGIDNISAYSMIKELQGFTVTEFELRLNILLNCTNLKQYSGQTFSEQKISEIQLQNVTNTLY